MIFKYSNKIYYLIFILLILSMILANLYYFHEIVLNQLDAILMPNSEKLCGSKSDIKNIEKLKNITKSMTLLDVEKEISKLFQQKMTKTSIRFRKKVAIIVPYRNRENNLKTFLLYIYSFLFEQNSDDEIDYGIYIIEPIDGILFNRGLVINAGVIEALKDDNNWNCFIFHDVDLLPENIKNIYDCDYKTPKLMASTSSSFNYR
jgi:NADH:ubiquinone oxidoreductase subunit